MIAKHTSLKRVGMLNTRDHPAYNIWCMDFYIYQQCCTKNGAQTVWAIIGYDKRVFWIEHVEAKSKGAIIDAL